MACFGIYQMRLPSEKIWNTDIETKRREFYEEIIDESQRSKIIYQSKNIIFSDNFIGMNIMGKDCTIENFKRALEERCNDNGVSEYMCHPVYVFLNFRDIKAQIIGMISINLTTETMK
jgi:hypothetical protein